MKRKLFIDLDGVLFDFEKKFEEDYGVPINSLTKKGVDAIKERLAYDMFFLELEPFHGAKAFVEYCVAEGYDVEFLTSVGKFNSDLVLKQKAMSIGMHISGSIELNHTYRSEDKAKMLEKYPDAILIDDRDKSLIPWEDAGGAVVKHYNFFDTIAELSLISVPF